MEEFEIAFFRWADVLDVDEAETMIVLQYLDRTRAGTPDEREAVEAVLAEIGPAQAARMVELSEGLYLVWLIEQRRVAIVPSMRAARRARELVAMPYRHYLATPEWAERAAETRRRFGHRCAVCNADAELDAHHRTYERRGAEEPADLTALCRACHALFHEWRDLAAVPPASA
jgi:5-methylcytosine-specific restriction endonuclease McrA